MRIYVACLASYNAGILHGDWIEINQQTDVDEINECIKEMLRLSPTPNAEEYAVHDYEDLPSGLPSSEHPDLQELCDVAEAMARHGEVFEAALSYLGNVEDALNACDGFLYSGDTKTEIAELYLEDSGYLDTVPDIIKYHIDYKGIARYLEMGGDWFFARLNGTVYAFSNHFSA